MANNKSDPRKCTTPEFRVSFPHVFKPNAFVNPKTGESQEPKFRLVMLFDKKADLTALKKARVAAIREKWGDDKAKWPKNLRSPFRDGSEKSDMEGYEGKIFVSASSKQKPGLVNQQVQAIISEDEFYAGCYARATLFAYAYDAMGNKGVAFGLQNIQKLRDGESFSGRKKAEDEFDAVDDDIDISDEDDIDGTEDEDEDYL